MSCPLRRYLIDPDNCRRLRHGNVKCGKFFQTGSRTRKMWTSNWRIYTYTQIPATLFGVAQALMTNVLTDYVEYLECVNTFDGKEIDCDVLHTNTTSVEAHFIESQIQKEVNKILITLACVQMVIPAILMLFIGPWSDVHGRKPIILLVLTCAFLSHLGLILVACFYNNAWLIPAVFLPMTFSGGTFSLISASYTSISDVTRPDSRAWHLSFFLILTSCGSLIGQLMGAYIFETLNYVGVFSSAVIVNAIALVYMIYLVPESLKLKKVDHKEEEDKDIVQQKSIISWLKIFMYVPLQRVVNAAFTEREDFDKGTFWLCILIFTFFSLTTMGESAVLYLFTEARMGWNISTVSYFSTASIIYVRIFGTLVGAKVLKYCMGNSETTSSLIFIVPSCVEVFTYSLATKTWHMYLGKGFGLFSLSMKPLIRAVFTKSVPSADLGKLFVLSTSIEALMAFGGKSLYSTVYTYTMPPLYPSPVWLLSVLFNILIMLLIFIVHIRQPKLNALVE